MYRNVSEFFPFKKCRIVPKNVKGGPFSIYIHFIAKQQKTQRHSAEKN